MSQSAFDIKPFIGSRDFDTSRNFYLALGWTLQNDTGDLAELQLGDCRLYLQNYYQREWCENTMLHIAVDDAQYWYDHARQVIDSGSYGDSKVHQPAEQTHGSMVTFVWDPAGVLLHFSQAQ